MTQQEFAALAYQVMGKLFEIHEDLGRLFDEQIYRRELLQRLPEVHGEVLVEVHFDSFSKRYYLDILFQGAIFELKAVEAFAPRHRAQLLTWINLTRPIVAFKTSVLTPFIDMKHSLTRPTCVNAIFLSTIFLSSFFCNMSYEVELKFPVPDLPAFSRKLVGSIHCHFSRPGRDRSLLRPSCAGFRANGRGPAPPPQGRCELHHLQRPENRRHDQDPPRDRTVARAGAGIVGLLDRTVGSGRFPAGGRSPQVPPQGRDPLARPPGGSLLGRTLTGVGTFVEFELVAEESEVEAARACIQSLAQSFGLTQGERRSYLEILLEGK